jgi:hypothetical protein
VTDEMRPRQTGRLYSLGFNTWHPELLLDEGEQVSAGAAAGLWPGQETVEHLTGLLQHPRVRGEVRGLKQERYLLDHLRTTVHWTGLSLSSRGFPVTVGGEDEFLWCGGLLYLCSPAEQWKRTGEPVGPPAHPGTVQEPTEYRITLQLHYSYITATLQLQ